MQNYKTILAQNAKPGMTMVFHNENFNYLIEEVEFTRDGEIKITHGNDTGVDFFISNEPILVRSDWD